MKSLAIKPSPILSGAWWRSRRNSGGQSHTRNWSIMLAVLGALTGCGGGGGSSSGSQMNPTTNAAPVITSAASATVPENATLAQSVTATDSNGDVLTFSVTGGSDRSAFTIGASTGALNFSVPPDFEVPTDDGANNVYEVEITVSDGQGGTATTTVNVTVTGVDEPPVFASATSLVTEENDADTGYIAVVDDPEGNPVTLTMSGADAGQFVLDAGTGALTFVVPPDFENPMDADANNQYLVDIVADDGAQQSTLVLTLTVTDVFEQTTGFWLLGLGPFGGQLNSMAIDSTGVIYVGTGSSGCNGYSCGRNGIFVSSDGGGSWQPSSTGLTNVHVNSLAVSAGGEVYAGTYFGGVFESDDQGATWSATGPGMTANSVVDAVATDSGNTVFAGTRAGEVFRSQNGGDTWELVLSASSDSFSSILVSQTGTVLVAGLNSYRSTDGGDSWSAIGPLSGAILWFFGETSTGAFFGSGATGVYRSLDDGVTWSAVNGGLPATPRVTSIVEAASGDLIAGSTGYYRSTDGGSTWSATAPADPLRGVADLQRGPSGVLFAATDAGAYLSSDDGTDFSASNSGLANGIVAVLTVAADGTVYAGFDGGVGRSDDGGSTWAVLSEGLPGGVSALLQRSNGSLVAGTESGEVFESSNAAVTWQAMGSTGFGTPVTSIVEVGGDLFACSGGGSAGDGIVRSTDGGVTWSPVNAGLGSTNVQSLAIADDGTIFAASDGIYHSIDAGGSWTLVHPTSAVIWQLTVHDGAIVGATTQGLVMSTDGGSSWIDVTEVPTSWIQSIAISDTGDAYLGTFQLQPSAPSVLRYTFSNGVWAPINDGFTSNVALTPLSLATGPDGLVYAGLSGGGVAVGGAD